MYRGRPLNPFGVADRGGGVGGAPPPRSDLRAANLTHFPPHCNPFVHISPTSPAERPTIAPQSPLPRANRPASRVAVARGAWNRPLRRLPSLGSAAPVPRSLAFQGARPCLLPSPAF